MLKRYILFFFATYLSFFVSAQTNQKTINGFVVNSYNEKIEGASVFINNKLKTVTNIEGYFELKTYDTDTIKIKTLNYESWSSLVFKLPLNKLFIKLKNRIIQLEEVSIIDNSSFIIDSLLSLAFKKMQTKSRNADAFLRQWLTADGKYCRVSEALIKVNIPSNVFENVDKIGISLSNSCLLKDSLKYRYNIATDVKKMMQRGLKPINLYYEIIQDKHKSRITELNSTTEIVLSNDMYILKWVLNNLDCTFLNFSFEKKIQNPLEILSYQILYGQFDKITVMLKLKYKWEGIKRKITGIIGEELFFNYEKTPKSKDIVDNFKHNDLKDYKSKEGDCAIIEKYKTDFNIPSFIYDR